MKPYYVYNRNPHVRRGNPCYHIEVETNGRHFADDTFKRIFVNENVRILIEISLKFVPKDPMNNIPALVQVMAWRRPGDKPLSEAMMFCLPTHICVTRPQWVLGIPIHGMMVFRLKWVQGSISSFMVEEGFWQNI